jgi:hypothetical protein
MVVRNHYDIGADNLRLGNRKRADKREYRRNPQPSQVGHIRIGVCSRPTSPETTAGQFKFTVSRRDIDERECGITADESVTDVS